jgi:oligopeptide transport system substrate-binding protein
MTGVTGVSTLDPIHAIDPASIAMCSLLYEGLVRLAANGTVLPGAASSWRVNRRGTVYTFSLRSNLRFSNGELLTAKDVVRSYHRAYSPTVVQPGVPGYIPELRYRHGQPDIYRTKQGEIVFVLSNPAPQFLEQLTGALTFARTYIVDMATVGRYGPVWTQHEDGLGPFAIQRSTKATIILRPNRYYAGAKPRQGTSITFTTEPASAVSSFQAGDADLVTGLSPTTTLPDSVKRDAQRVVQPNLDFVVFNTQTRPFDNVRNRVALASSLDRPGFVSSIYRRSASPQAAVVPNSILASSGAATPTKAATLARRPVPRFVFPNAEPQIDVAHLLARDWNRATGMTFKLAPEPLNSYIGALHNGTFNLALASWGARDADPTDFLDQLLPGSGEDLAGWSNAGFRSLMARARRFPVNSVQRNAVLTRAVAFVDRKAPWIALDSPVSLNLVSPRDVEIAVSPFGVVVRSGHLG